MRGVNASWAEGALWGKRFAVPGEGTVQALLFPLVTSWQISKLKGLSSSDIQLGRAGPGRPGGPQFQLEGLDTAHY